MNFISELYEYYPLILILQGFCLFHSYKNNNHQKWLWLIVFLPIIGSVIYLYENFYHQLKNKDWGDEIKGAVFSSHHIEKLQKQVEVSNTHQSRYELADAYMEVGRYDDAMKMYELCRRGIYENDKDLLQKLMRCQFLRKNYTEAVQIGEKLETYKDSIKSYQIEYKVAYAWSLYFIGRLDDAKNRFGEMNTQFANLEARKEYAKFLIEINEKDNAKILLSQLVKEYDLMNAYEKNLKRAVYKEIKNLIHK